MLKKGVGIGAEIYPTCVKIDPVIPVVAEVDDLTVTGDEGARKAAAATVERCSDNETVAEVAASTVGV